MRAFPTTPVIVAPMAGGGTTPELAAEVSGAGGFGYLAGGYLTPEALRGQIDRVRALTSAPFGVNLFVPGKRVEPDLTEYAARVSYEAARYDVEPGSASWEDDDYPAKWELVREHRVPVVSFTFGCPSAAAVRGLHEVGSEVVVTVTTPAEARIAADVGADALCVQGAEAGGHRAVFTDDSAQPGGGPLYGLVALLRLVAAEVDLPLIAAGGLADGTDLAAVRTAGAAAAQLGTAFLVTDEAGTKDVHRKELLAGARATALTRAFSGRPARGLVNRFLAEHTDVAPAAYPQVHHLTKPIRAAAAAAEDPEAVHLWAGQGYSRVRAMPAAELVRLLATELG